MDAEKTYNATEIYKMGMLKFIGLTSWPKVLAFISKNIESGELKGIKNSNRGYEIRASEWNAFIEKYSSSAKL